VYGIADRTFVGSIGRCPGRYGLADQVAVVTAADGLYGYHGKDGGALYRANVAAGKWEQVAAGGPPKHHERNHLCYDSKRSRLVYFRHDSGNVWAFDLETKAWTEETCAGRKPPHALGDSTYIPELDAALLIFPETRARDAPEKMFFYKLDERKWYTAPYRGDRAGRANDGLSHSPAYDPELRVVVRFMHVTREQWVETFVMRLDPDRLTLRPLQ